MSTPYVRRPVLEGNTDVPVQAQPYLQGTVRKTSAGIIPGFATLVATDAADFVVESDLAGGGPITVTFTSAHSDLLTDIISTINGYLSGVATASERDGCLRLQTDSVGETVLGIKSFIRVYPATNDYLGTGIPQDCASLFGFACYPDPAATVTAGDIESAATRPVEQGNLPGTRFIARGEDRTSAAFNRALSQLALNADITRTAAVREAYYPVNVELDFTDAYAAGWLRFDINGNTTQIKLSALTDLFPMLAGRLYVGDLSNESTLREIAKYWGLSDTEGRALSAYDEYYETTRTLRIGAVTRGEQGFGRMYFEDALSGAPDEDSAPVSSILDTQYVVADGRNALGVSRLKQPTTSITEIRGKTNVVCGSLATPVIAPTSTTSPTAGVGFKSHGVAKGDVAVIASALVTSPFCHNGTYYVEDVISEQELILRPISDTDVESLNPGDSGSFGEITIYSSTEWSDDVWVTLDPPLPRFPDNKLVLTFGIERETLNQREDIAGSYTDTSAVSDNSELTAFQGLQFWQRQSLGGAYAGMSADRTADAGSIIKERTRSVTLVAPEKSTPSAGTYVRGPFSGSLLGEGVLAASGGTPPTYDDTFSLADVGRVVKLSGGALLDLEPFLITEFIDGAHVRLAPLGASPGSELPSYGSVDYEVYEDVVDYPSPLLTLIAPDQDRDDNPLSDVGVLYIREQNNTDFLPTRQHGRPLLHLERVSVGYGSPGTATNIRTVEVTATSGDQATVSVSVELFQNIFAVEGGTTRPVEPPYNGGSIFRIMNGPNAGFYLIQSTTSADILTLRTLDGDTASLTSSGVPTPQIGAFYNAHVSVGHKLAGTGYGDVAYRTAKLRVFFDSLEQGEEAGVGLSLDWRGQGAGISAQLNDADFVAYDSEAGATGYLIDAQIYSPAHGINLSVTGADSGETERRSARGANIAVEGHQTEVTPANWGRLLGGETLSSWGAHVHQEGSDPALVITKGVDVGTDFAHPTDAAVQVRLAPIGSLGTRVYRATGGALDVTGSIYLRHPLSNSPGGALYSETGVSAFQYLSSMVPPYFNNDRDGIYSFDDPEGATELGSSDQAYPTLSVTPAPTADLLPPDYTKFPFHHHGVVQVLDDAGFSDFLSPWGLGAERHVGKVIEVSDSYAYGTVTVLGPVTNGKTVTIGGIPLLADATPDVTNDQFQSGAAAIATAVSLAAAINDLSGSLYGTVTAVADGATVTITAVVVGSAGNTIALVTDAPTELSLSGALVYPSANGTFTVHALHVVQAGNDAYVAVTSGNSTTPWAAAQTGTFRMYGRRWHRSYLNIADYALLGTWDTTASRTDLPALTSVDQLVNERQTEVINNIQFPSMGLQSIVSWSPIADGASLGFDAALTDPSMSQVAVDATTYAAASSWVGGSEGAYFGHGWANDTQQPRSPFPNRALFSGGEFNTGDVTVEPGSLNSLAADDYTATFPTGSGMSVYWSANWGGTLAVEFTSGTTATAKVWQKGRTYVLSAHLSLRVRLRVAGDLITAPPRITTLSVALCKPDGTVVWSPSGVLPPTSLAAVPEDREYVVTLDDLYKGAPDALNSSLQTEQLHLVLTIGTTDTGTAYVLEFTAEQETRPAVVSGPQVVAGAQLAHTYRFTDPVRGFQTVGPADARLLGGLDYARNESWPTYDGGLDGWEESNATGTQELRGNPGLVRMTSSVNKLAWAAAKQIAANAITGSIDAWMTDLKTVATAGYGGTYPGACADEVTVVSDACDTALAETDPTIKLEDADIAVAAAYALIDCVEAYAARLNSGTNSGTAYTRANLATYVSDIEDAIAGGSSISDADEYTALAANAPEENWVRPWVDYYRLFSQGVHSASVTLYNGAFDPLWYARQADFIYNTTGSTAGGSVRVDAFVPPGMTGFLIPLDPPHGSVMTSLAIGLSFRAHKSNYWGIYRGMPDALKQMGRNGADNKTYPTLAVDTDWDSLQGVVVELWRYNAIDFDVSEDDFASWTEHEPEFGFGERLAQFSIDLSGVSPPSDTANTVTDAWSVAALLSNPKYDVYAGKEHFEKRNWNLLEAFGSGDSRARVDRRHYSYTLVVRFYGGMRYHTGGYYFPYVRGDRPPEEGGIADSRWELPQTITRKIGSPEGVPAEGQIYGHFESVYPAESPVEMNEPWGDTSSFPPQVKFRGARLGWTTDRAGDGGW
jgi:hypothetical protein